MRIIEWTERRAVKDRGVPAHVALIMDGNRRWGAARGISAVDAHLSSAPALVSCIEEARWLNVSHVTFFALAARNLDRSTEEVDSLVKLRRWLWTSEVLDAVETADANVHVIGEYHDERIVDDILHVVEHGRQGQGEIDVCFAVNYSSRAELLDGLTTAADPTSADREYNSFSKQTPDIDLLIRPGGEQRLSDFMLWHVAHAELVFTDTLWPDFRGLHFSSAVAEFQQRQRRYGR
ncbi:polyprenyl diphosphate synthase [Nocardia sp. NPDC060259]|uniref:polyprenyl diphosphate synthase n=1 Tax=Nocardia sp. NPDC060259 TaxID=3347088 RepID=UPI0036512A54